MKRMVHICYSLSEQMARTTTFSSLNNCDQICSVMLGQGMLFYQTFQSRVIAREALPV